MAKNTFSETFSLRFTDRSLLDKLEGWTEITGMSRNKIILLLIEDGMKRYKPEEFAIKYITEQAEAWGRKNVRKKN